MQVKLIVNESYSFSNHSTPPFIKGSLHDSIICSRWTWPNNKRIWHMQPINSNTEIRLRNLSLWSKNPEMNSAGTSLNLPRAIQGKPRCRFSCSDLGHAQRRHCWSKNGKFSVKLWRKRGIWSNLSYNVTTMLFVSACED